jgi:hypothetical protein
MAVQLLEPLLNGILQFGEQQHGNRLHLTG